ncbi:DAK2 domain-containing protein [Corynebacterium sp. MC-04]|nr:DAK2 domain-containing protein [Corynebacterium parakroppenstedtii]PMC66755.1 DAK2 domain-containing protein [Corynebacterium kroppenstedtii]MCF6768960.1 DAK2 domain-containing protein [Corynebacterium parakroppenstedtii]MCF6778376.1 DAK2 domain-containing protein [Corynebacterium parakroppenstedtii]MCF6788626.1 DAK2 domain-containing protein [Corynebacterium parakroppenstedtii]MCF6809077.1 DAK2 domain-containing protein [Corynebacterium parakroppenstedtii]
MGTSMTKSLPDAIDSTTLQRWARACAHTLARQKEEINRLNVFPVPDSDTGSNMAFTMASAVSALDHALREREMKKSRLRTRNGTGVGSSPHRDDTTELTTSEAAIALAIGATKGSRGNSGVVLSQLLRGLAESAQAGPLNGASVCDALSNSLRFVQAAIVNPVEGTVITVLRSAAAAATSAAHSTDSAGAVAHAARLAASRALERTPSQLPVLRRAGVVDAGGRGLVVLLEELERVLSTRAGHVDAFNPADIDGKTTWTSGDSLLTGSGWSAQGLSASAAINAMRASAPGTGNDETGAGHTSGGSASGESTAADASASQLEVMFFIEDTDLEDLRTFLVPLGDSLIVGALTDHSARIHIHTNRAGEVISGAYERGDVSELTVETLHQVSADRPSALQTARPRLRSVLAVVPSEDAAAFFGRAGADTVVIEADEKAAEQHQFDVLREAIAKEDVDEVVLLTNGIVDPHDVDGHMPNVVVVPASSLCAGLAAMAVHDPSQSLDADAAAMVDAARGTTTMALSYDDMGGRNDTGHHDDGPTSGELTPPPAAIRAWETVTKLLAKGGELVTVISADDHWSRVVQSLPQSDNAEYSFFTIPKCGAAVMIGVE